MLIWGHGILGTFGAWELWADLTAACLPQKTPEEDKEEGSGCKPFFFLKIGIEARLEAVWSELDHILLLKEDQKTALKAFLTLQHVYRLAPLSDWPDLKSFCLWRAAWIPDKTRCFVPTLQTLFCGLLASCCAQFFLFTSQVVPQTL